MGVGWNHVEYEALGYDFRGRGVRQEEQIDVLRRLFTDPVVDFTGSFHRIDRASLIPKPGRAIPIWLGGFSEAAFDRAARIADGFIFFGAAQNTRSTRGTRWARASMGCEVDVVRGANDFDLDVDAVRRRLPRAPRVRGSWAGGRRSSSAGRAARLTRLR